MNKWVCRWPLGCFLRATCVQEEGKPEPVKVCGTEERPGSWAESARYFLQIPNQNVYPGAPGSSRGYFAAG